MMVFEIDSTTKYWDCSVPVKSECGKQVQSNSLLKSKIIKRI